MKTIFSILLSVVSTIAYSQIENTHNVDSVRVKYKIIFVDSTYLDSGSHFKVDVIPALIRTEQEVFGRGNYFVVQIRIDDITDYATIVEGVIIRRKLQNQDATVFDTIPISSLDYLDDLEPVLYFSKFYSYDLLSIDD